MDASFCVAEEAASVLPNKKIRKISESTKFDLHLSYLSDTLGVMNHCNWYLFKGPGSNILYR